MRNSIHNDYLAKENSNCLKFIFSIAVVLCHLFAYEPFGESYGIGVIFTALGYLSVSIFLFFSGYGLTISYINKGDSYFKFFLKNRVLPIYVIQAILIPIYSLFQFVIGNNVTWKLIIQSFLFGDSVVKYGWYIQMIILFYIIYYFAFLKSTIKNGIIKLSLGVLSFCIICIVLKMSHIWFESSLAFILGTIWAYKKNKIDSLVCVPTKYVIVTIAVVFVFAFTFILGNAGLLPMVIKIPIKMISAVFFVIFVLLMVMKIRIKYKPLEFAGNYYFEIYFLQGFFLTIFNEIIIIDNILVRYVVCIISIFITAILIKPVVNFINNKCKGVN